MKNLIVQIFIDKKGWEEEHRLDAQSQQVLILSNILVKNYARKINAEYKLISKPIINFKHPTWERFQLFNDEWITKYKNILYLDTDVFTWPDAPNIFDSIDVNSFNVVKRVNERERLWNGLPSFNAGVFAINKSCAIEMRKFLSKSNWLKNFTKDPLWEDSKELNTLAQISNIKINWLNEAWNIKNDPNAYFTHLWGNQKKLFPNMPAIIKAKKIVKGLIDSGILKKI
tara:strand:- start:329 stop:1012 length:684 start_codon:yes stop_codon:yes gene_type:complete